MRTSATALGGAALGSRCVLPDRRPNIVVILADDMGFSDLGCFGSRIETPNIDRLARNGLVMPQFYNTGRCCPTRASLLTGLYPHQCGIGDMNGDDNLPGYRGMLNRNCVTIAELLRTAGYTTMMTGKWHVGNHRDHWPRKRGFDRFYGLPHGGGVYFHPFRPGRIVILDDDEVEVDPENFYSTDVFSDWAVRFLDENEGSGKPFFLYSAYVAPHFPLQAWDEDIAKYRGRFKDGFQNIRQDRYLNLKSLGLIPDSMRLSPVDDLVLDWNDLSSAKQDEFDLRMAVYAAQLHRLDQGVGRIINKIKDMGELENTLVFFLSDNGASPEDPTGWLDSTAPLGKPGCQEGYLRSWANVSNTPFRLYKHWVHEGGIASPLIAHYPEKIRKPRIDSQIGHVMDLMSTCIQLGSAQYPVIDHEAYIHPMEGRSLLPVFDGKTRENYPDLFWEHQGNRAVRSRNWKLVSKTPGNIWELYDVAEDRTELSNLAGFYPERVEEMAGQYERWTRRVNCVPYEQIQEKRNQRNG